MENVIVLMHDDDHHHDNDEEGDHDRHYNAEEGIINKKDHFRFARDRVQRVQWYTMIMLIYDNDHHDNDGEGINNKKYFFRFARDWVQRVHACRAWLWSCLHRCHRDDDLLQEIQVSIAIAIVISNIQESKYELGDNPYLKEESI